MCRGVADKLRVRGFEAEWSGSAAQAVDLLSPGSFDVALIDLDAGRATGVGLCEYAVRCSDASVVAMTEFANPENVARAIRIGACDFIVKPPSIPALALSLERATHYRRMRVELERLRRRVELNGFPSMVGDSPLMRQMNATIDRVAASDASVLITGESGTGKELIARALHDRSGRKGAFCALNCAAMPGSLLESELFGHAQGAFTDAGAAREGLFRQARHGTLFLDEVGEMPPGMQAKLLRALQERKVRPIAGCTELPFDARVVAATNRDLEEEVAQRRFREDLYYRLNVLRISVPPLRRRGNDVLQLAHYFLARRAARSQRPISRLSIEAAERLISHDWPGNVRELENCIEHAVALAAYDQIALNDLPPRLREGSGAAASTEDPAALPSMRSIEYRYVRRVLRAVNGNKTLAAKIIGFDRRTLYRKLAAWSRPGNAYEELDDAEAS